MKSTHGFSSQSIKGHGSKVETPKGDMRIIDEQTGVTEAESGFDMRYGSTADIMKEVQDSSRPRNNTHYKSNLRMSSMPKIHVNINLN